MWTKEEKHAYLFADVWSTRSGLPGRLAAPLGRGKRWLGDRRGGTRLYLSSFAPCAFIIHLSSSI